MGSTSAQTIKPARALFDKGDFTGARREFKTLVSDGVIDHEVLVKMAICDFRLGRSDALNQLRSSHFYGNVSPELESLARWHEFVGMIAEMRFEPALNLLVTGRPMGNDTECVRHLGEVIVALRRASVISTRTTKGRHLDEALSLCEKILQKNTGGTMREFIGLMNDYLMLMQELMRSLPDRRLMQECRMRITTRDPMLGKRLPAERRLVNFTPSFKR